MANTNVEGAKLFIVCPFCTIEHLIRENYGDVLFLTAVTACYEFTPENFSAITRLIQTERISDIYIVMDNACRFSATEALTNTNNKPCAHNQTQAHKKSEVEMTRLLKAQAAIWQKRLYTHPGMNATSLKVHTLISSKNLGLIKEVNLANLN